MPVPNTEVPNSFHYQLDFPEDSFDSDPNPSKSTTHNISLSTHGAVQN